MPDFLFDYALYELLEVLSLPRSPRLAMITIAVGPRKPSLVVHLFGTHKDFADVLVWPATAIPPRVKAPQVIETELV